MKKLTSYFLAASLLFSSANFVNAQSPNIQIKINGMVQELEPSPVIINDLTLVPLRGIFERLGVTVEWDDERRRITATKDATVVILDVGSKTGFVNGKPISLDIEAQIVNGRTMVPLRFISESFGFDVKWDDNRKTVIINTNEEAREMNRSGNDQSDTSHVNGFLTLEEAVERALARSNELRRAQRLIEQAEIALDDASDNIQYIPDDGSNIVAKNVFSGWTRAQVNYFMQQRQYEVNKESVEYAVKNAYFDILNKQEELKVARLNTEHQEWKQRMTDVKYRNNMASSFEVSQINNALDEARAREKAAEEALAEAYTKFNQLIGERSDARLNLVDRPRFEKMSSVDLDHHVSRVVSSSVALWMAEQQIKLAELDLRLFTFNDPTNPNSYAQQQIEVNKAKLSAENVKDQLEGAARTIYYSIRQLEEQYEHLLANKRIAEDALKIAQARYDAGMATALELFEARLAVEQTEQAMFSIVTQLESLKIAFDKPWVMGVSQS